MKPHPRDEQLLEYSEGESRTDEARERIESHLAGGCPACRSKIEGFRTALALLAAGPLEKMPDRAREAAMDALREAGAIRAVSRSRTTSRIVATAREALERVPMALRLDTGTLAVIPGTRSQAAASMQPRRLLFEASRGSLHLQIDRGARGRVDLSGQFLPSEGEFGGETGQVFLERGGRARRAVLAETGEFRFPSVPAQGVRLRIEWRDVALLVGPLDLGTAAASPSGGSDPE